MVARNGVVRPARTIVAWVAAVAIGGCAAAPADGPGGSLRTSHETELGAVVAESRATDEPGIWTRLAAADGTPLGSMRWAAADGAITWELASGQAGTVSLVHTPTLETQNLSLVAVWLSTALAAAAAAEGESPYATCTGQCTQSAGCLCCGWCCPRNGSVECSFECWGACMPGGS